MISDQPHKSIPHRPPFVLVNRLMERNSDGTDGWVEFDVKQDLSVFQGHFPGHPVLPGVYQIEMAAQSSLWVFCGDLPLGAQLPEVLFRGTEFTFRKEINPGCVLRAHVWQKEQKKKYFYMWGAELFIGSDKVSEGDLRMVLLKGPIVDGVEKK